jgi:hypothetical protein
MTTRIAGMIIRLPIIRTQFSANAVAGIAINVMALNCVPKKGTFSFRPTVFPRRWL